MVNAWMVRAGRHGEREDDALDQSLVIAGWPEMGNLTQFDTRKELRTAVRAAYPNRSSTVVANWAGQLWRLRHVIQVGDLVVTPLKKTNPDHVAIGTVAGPYQFRQDAPPDRRHVRPVAWLQAALPRSAIQQDLLYSLGSLLTICQLQRNGAARRIAALALTGSDPGPAADELTNNEWQTPDDFLARAVADPDGLELSIRELLAQWGIGRRTSAPVEAIQRDLAENGLTTVPSFTEGWIGKTVRLVKSGAEEDDTTVETAAEKLIDEQGDAAAVSEAPDDDDELVPEKPFTLRFGNLLRSDAAVTSVRPTDSIVLARTLMLRHNYSQLAVIDDDCIFHCAVSWESIAKAYMSQTPPVTVSQAKHPALQAGYDDLVLPRIDDISSSGFIFIRSRDSKTVAGIITAADLTNRFGEIAKPFTEIEECERRLQRRVKAHISADIIEAATNKRYKNADKLTFGAYPYVLKDAKNFALLGWALDHEEFVKQVQEVAKIRNRMMHFSPDPIPTEEWGAIDGLLAMLHAVEPLP
jgi:restriction system protein